MLHQLCRRTGPTFAEGHPVFNDITSVTLNTALAGLSERQRVTAHNIANLDTPNFHASRVDFEDSLAIAIQRSDPGSTQIANNPTNEPVGLKDNNVNLEDELVTATQTGLQQKLMTGTITTRFGWMQTVAKV